MAIANVAEWTKTQVYMRHPFEHPFSPRGRTFHPHKKLQKFSTIAYTCRKNKISLTHPSLFASQAPINFTNSEFYGFSELFYCTEDVLRLGGPYDSRKYSRAAAVWKKKKSPPPPHTSARGRWSDSQRLTGCSVWFVPCRTTAPPSGRH